MKYLFAFILFCSSCLLLKTQTLEQHCLYSDWKYIKQRDVASGNPENIQFDDTDWLTVKVPHHVREDDLVPDDPRPVWKQNEPRVYAGVVWYRKKLHIPADKSEMRVIISFEAVHNIATVYINGQEVSYHEGGYLPFQADLTPYILFGEDNMLAVKVDNRVNKDIPPGVDWFNPCGIYRNVVLEYKDPVHITDAVSADIAGGGGVFIRTDLDKDHSRASVIHSVHINNKGNENKQYELISRIVDKEGNTVSGKTSSGIIEAASGLTIQHDFDIEHPHLWDFDNPYLYTMEDELAVAGTIVENRKTCFGVRHINFTFDEGFKLNGKPVYLRGTNRMQIYPYVFDAMPNSGQVLDARKIKESGFLYVRLHAYPQSPAFLDELDELGIVAIAQIPGFQYMGGETFRRNCFRHLKDMIRRDRNHPCIIGWEVEPNETWNDNSTHYADSVYRIAHEEYPGDQCFVGACWTDPAYYDFHMPNGGDVIDNTWAYTQATTLKKPMIVYEYGHWEYRETGRSSDVNIKDGEKKMLDQVYNHAAGHSLQKSKSPAINGDGLFVQFDYTEYPSGILDNFRLPKFSDYFWKSQRNPELQPLKEGLDAGPMIFIANYNLASSPRDITVFSNCERVELYNNGNLYGEGTKSDEEFYAHIAYKPFVFKDTGFIPGELKAVGYINSEAAATHIVNTPGAPAFIRLAYDPYVYNLKEGEDDILFIYASLVDDKDNIIRNYTGYYVDFEVNGVVDEIHSPLRIKMEAGVATFMIRVGNQPGNVRINASAAIRGETYTGSMEFTVKEKEYTGLQQNPIGKKNEKPLVYQRNKAFFVEGLEGKSQINLHDTLGKLILREHVETPNYSYVFQHIRRQVLLLSILNKGELYAYKLIL